MHPVRIVVHDFSATSHDEMPAFDRDGKCHVISAPRTARRPDEGLEQAALRPTATPRFCPRAHARFLG